MFKNNNPNNPNYDDDDDDDDDDDQLLLTLRLHLCIVETFHNNKCNFAGLVNKFVVFNAS